MAVLFELDKVGSGVRTGEDRMPDDRQSSYLPEASSDLFELITEGPSTSLKMIWRTYFAARKSVDERKKDAMM